MFKDIAFQIRMMPIPILCRCQMEPSPSIISVPLLAYKVHQPILGLSRQVEGQDKLIVGRAYFLAPGPCRSIRILTRLQSSPLTSFHSRRRACASTNINERGRAEGSFRFLRRNERGQNDARSYGRISDHAENFPTNSTVVL
jgi:hypothetical protein